MSNQGIISFTTNMFPLLVYSFQLDVVLSNLSTNNLDGSLLLEIYAYQTQITNNLWIL